MMKPILARENREVLERFARSKVLLAFDYDGTLAPIVTLPDRACMRATTQELFARAAELYPTIVVSGRAQADVRGRLGSAAVQQVVGNHGLEPWHGSEALVAEVRGWPPILAASLRHVPGVWIEDKTYSLAVHYRGARDEQAAHAAVRQAAAGLGPVRLVGGKCVVNILPAGAPHKGTAVEGERERLRCDTALYVGDDETDEDVFALDQPDRLLTIRVGPKRDSAARYCLPRQSAIDELLRVLVALRSDTV
jgi:trehalose 6-phosphate phosphatase